MTERLKLSRDRKVSPRGSGSGTRTWATLSNSFGLPSGVSCPGKTRFCLSCYGEAAERRPEVAGLLAHNMRLLQAAETTERMTDLLLEMMEGYRFEADRRVLMADEMLFRIHWDGDFWSADYARAWAEVMYFHDDVKFWAYTRSFVAPLNVVPILADVPNLALYLSIDADNVDAARPILAAHPGVLAAFCSDSHDRANRLIPERPATPCPENAGRIPLMVQGRGACVTCGICPDARRDISFASHGKKAAPQPVFIKPKRECRGCGAELPTQEGPGRPRVWCDGCRRPVLVRTVDQAVRP